MSEEQIQRVIRGRKRMKTKDENDIFRKMWKYGKTCYKVDITKMPSVLFEEMIRELEKCDTAEIKNESCYELIIDTWVYYWQNNEK